MPKSSWAPPKGMRGKCERRRGNINADAAGAEVFAGDGCSQGASFGPMAAISRRGQGGRIYNNTRTRERLRRKCVKPADLTTHSPPKTVTRPRTATRPSRALSLPHAAPTHARRLRDARPPTSQPIPRRRPSLLHAQRHALPEHFRSPPQPRRTPAGCAMHSQPTAQPIPRRSPSLAPAQRHAPPEHFCSPRSTDARPPTARCTPAALTTHSPLRHAASPSVPLRAQKNGTAQCMCDAECFGRPSLRSVIWVGEPRAVRRRCGALACRRGA